VDVRHILLALCLPAAAVAAQPVKKVEAPAWAAAQAAGPPDAGVGDDPKAWASLQADAGAEWLELRYEKAVHVARVVIHENENPGAIARVVAFDAAGGEVVLWEGVEPARQKPAKFEVKPARTARTDRLRIELDTTRVPGWNEIDAVQLVGADGSTQWAVAATASSSYADAAAGGSQPFAGLIGEPVRAHLAGGDVLEGRLVYADGQFARLEGAGGRVYVVALSALRYVEK
jgi:hypothetical protein